jgi:hypothetical protein
MIIATSKKKIRLSKYSINTYIKVFGAWTNFLVAVGEMTEEEARFKSNKRDWPPFDQAKDFVHGLKLKNCKDWGLYCRSRKRPLNITSRPSVIYAKEWKGWGDWLGTGRPQLHIGKRRSSAQLLDDLRTLGQTLGRRPRAWDLKNKSMVGLSAYSHHFGSWNKALELAGIKSELAGFKRQDYMPFDEARSFVRELKVKSKGEWGKYCESGNKPLNIPKRPDCVKAYSKYWISWEDWFGCRFVTAHTPWNKGLRHWHKG